MKMKIYSNVEKTDTTELLLCVNLTDILTI